MKFTLLAAAALIAVPALAQTTGTAAPTTGQGAMDPATQGTAAPAGDPATQSATPPAGDPAMQSATPPAGDPAMSQTAPAQTTGDASMAPATPAAMPAGDPNAADPAGGYQPASTGPGTPPPAGTVAQVQQQPTPDQAFPAPAPMAKYPVCKAGQYDNCMQASGGRSRRRR